VAVAPLGGDTEGGARFDHRRFERPDERPEEKASSREGKDRIGDQLTGAVVGDLAAPLDAENLNPAAFELGGRGQDVGWVGLPAEGQDGRVLDEQEAVADPTVRTLAGNPLLERPGLAIGHPTEPDRLERAHLGLVDRRAGWLDGGGDRRDGFHVGTIAGKASQPVGALNPGASRNWVRPVDGPCSPGR